MKEQEFVKGLNQDVGIDWNGFHQNGKPSNKQLPVREQVELYEKGFNVYNMGNPGRAFIKKFETEEFFSFKSSWKKICEEDGSLYLTDGVLVARVWYHAARESYVPTYIKIKKG